MSEIRIPTQERSKLKREKIIKKGFELMCNNGYYNTTTSDIAKYASVSTGIIYQYFNDKKDIFIEGFKYYSDDILFPILNILKDNKINYDNLSDVLDKLLSIFIKKHTLSKNAHEEMIALSHLDDDVGKIFLNNEIETTKRVYEVLCNNNICVSNMLEKVHIIIGIVENYCHEVVYHKHDILNYDAMKNSVIDIVCNILGIKKGKN